MKRFYFSKAIATSAFFLVLALSGSAAGRGSSPTINFVWLCEGREPIPETTSIGVAICSGYINGFIDSHVLTGELTPNTAAFCPPKQGITGDQARRIFLDWANRHPEELHKTLRVSLWFSLMAAFPCGR